MLRYCSWLPGGALLLLLVLLGGALLLLLMLTWVEFCCSAHPVIFSSNLRLVEPPVGGQTLVFIDKIVCIECIVEAKE